jgi:glycosyltransferase involved in cell wall biosynthesis
LSDTDAAQGSPRISIVTVSYQSSRTIERTLQSVAGQSWPAREHIVIDGGSTDGTIEIARKYESGLAALVSERDRGIYDAMNKGVARASGGAIGFLNSDDWYVDDTVLADVGNAFRDPDIDAVFGNVDFVRAENTDRVVRVYNSGRFRPDLLSSGWMPAHPGLFMRRSVFERVGPFRTDYRIAADFDFIVRAFSSGNLKYQYLPRTLVRMQLGGASTSGLASTVLLNREMMRALRENAVPTSWPRLLSRYFVKILQLVPSLEGQMRR